MSLFGKKENRLRPSITDVDVYETQQEQRSSIEGMFTFFESKVALGVIVGLGVLLLYGALSGLKTMSVYIQDQLKPIPNGISYNGYDPSASYPFVKEKQRGDQTLYYVVDEDGLADYMQAYDSKESVPVPAWYLEKQQAYEQYTQTDEYREKMRMLETLRTQRANEKQFMYNILHPTSDRILWSVGFGMALFTIVYVRLKKKMDAQNIMRDTSDINQHTNDLYIEKPEKLMGDYLFVPDSHLHHDAKVSSLISHVPLTNKGLNKKTFTVWDSDGEDFTTKVQPVFDSSFMEELFAIGEVEKENQKWYDPSDIKLFPTRPFDRPKDCDTVADYINKHWYSPDYAIKQPAGAYLVDGNDVNTILAAETRAGKGQTYLLPLLDVTTRSSVQTNIVYNDPKGETLVQTYVPVTYRGYQPIQLNLINPLNTDIYNPLLAACQCARDGDDAAVAQMINNMGVIFFPTTPGEDPVWANSSANTFKRSVYALIDQAMSQERDVRQKGIANNTPESVIAQQIDKIWGTVTMYNVFQFFVQLSSRVLPNPIQELNSEKEAFGNGDLTVPWVNQSDEERAQRTKNAQLRSQMFWNDAPECDMMTLYFNTIAHLPKNKMRQLIFNANASLNSMRGADKMMASVYGIALTALSFFTEPTVAKMTSGPMSQNVDLGGFGFPRRIRIRLHPDFLTKHRLIKMNVRWSMYVDNQFKEKYPTGYDHEDTITDTGWCLYIIDTPVPKDRTYIKCEIYDITNGYPLRTFYFQFDRGYLYTIDGLRYKKDPILNEKIARDGTIVQLQDDGSGVYKENWLSFKSKRVVFDPDSQDYIVQNVDTRVITDVRVNYSEKPKIVYMVTPPHMSAYAQLLLIMMKQLTDQNFEMAYLGKPDQKPLLRTHFVLDEFGNLQSNGSGVIDLDTLLSIALAQGLLFTLVLQTLSQMKKIYGEDMYSSVMGNVGNFVFLKSSDNVMLDDLSKRSGERHIAYIDSKSITTDIEKIAMKTEGRVNYTMAVRNENVITQNDLRSLTRGQNIIFRSQYNAVTIWNKNQMLQPMAFRLLKDNIQLKDFKISLRTVPTLSSAKDIDVLKLQPDYTTILDKQMTRALFVEQAEAKYRELYGYSEYDIDTMDKEVYAQDIMDLVDMMIEQQQKVDQENQEERDELTKILNDNKDLYNNLDMSKVKRNTQVMSTYEKNKQHIDGEDEIAKRYAHGTLSRRDIAPRQVNANGTGKRNPNLNMRILIENALLECQSEILEDTSTFTCKDNEVLDAKSGKVFFIYMEDGTVDIKPKFYYFLCSYNSDWTFANGLFSQALAEQIPTM